MDIMVLILLLLLGVLFLLVELLLLPGFSVGGVVSLLCNGWAIYLAFNEHSTSVGVIVCGIVAVASIITIIYSLRAKTWQCLSLKDKIESQSSSAVGDSIIIGTQAVTLSRLAPMGKIIINGEIYEAKLQSGYVDVNCNVEVIGYEDSIVIVKLKN